MIKSEGTRAEEMGESEQPARSEDDVNTSEAAVSGRGAPEAWRSKGFRLSVITAAFILAAGFSFAVGRIFGLGDTAVHSAIPAPLKGDDIFVEDQEGIAQDNLSNATEMTGEGIVHILAGGTSVGLGLVLTQSGKVLTTYQPAAGTAKLAAEYVLSGKAFNATVIGVDPAAGLALLQMEGADGRAFSTVTVGNSDMITSSAAAVREKDYHRPGEIKASAVSSTGTQDGISLDVGTVTTLNTTVVIDGTTWTGLMAAALESPLPWVLGDPLVNLNGHVIGIIVGNSRSGSSTVAYAIPINGALAAATQMTDGSA